MKPQWPQTWRTSIVPLLLLLVLPFSVRAQFDYVTNGAAITITRYVGPDGPVAIPSSIDGLPVTSIGWAAFYYAHATTVSIPNTVTNIGNNAFEGSWVANLSIPNSISSLGTNAFANCESLTNITIPKSVAWIGDSAFFGCENLANVTISDGVRWIGNAAFGFTYGLTGVTIPTSVTNIGRWAFDYSGVTYLIILDAPTSIGEGAFLRCIHLGSAALGNAVTIIGSNAFCNCTALKSVSIPGSVSSVGFEAWSECAGLTDVAILPGVTTIGDSAFYRCTGIPSLTIPASVRSIGDDAFNSCIRLANLTIRYGVTNIGTRAFVYCNSLTNVTIPGSVMGIGRLAFGSCYSLTNITVGPSNSIYSSAGGVLFDHSQRVLVEFPTGKAGTYTIPVSVSSIADDAFYESRLSSILVHSNVSSIGYEAFAWFSHLPRILFEGDAPSHLDSTAFTATYGTILFLPGANGWGSSLGGSSVMLWNPKAQTAAPSFGVRTNAFEFTVTGTSNLVVVVEACTNLVNPVWTPLRTNTLIDGSSYFSDPKSTNSRSRFYRMNWH